MKNELTILIISREDEDVIADAIRSSYDFGQVLVVDSNNNDETKKICSKLNVKTIKHPFKDFSDQRNFAILHATTPWVLYLDSDERLTVPFKNEVVRVISGYNEQDEVVGYFIKRKTFYFGKDWNFEDKVQRLFVRNKFIEWNGAVHESPKIKGQFSYIQSPIVHLTHRNLSQMVRKTNEWSEYEAKLRFSTGHPKLVPWRFARVMITAFVDSYLKNKGYKNGTHGLIEAMYQSFSMFITYAKLWEMQEGKRK